jgi:predicted outer membrane repeat protein
MAPGVTIESYGFEWSGGGIFLYSNPGDIERDYDEAINVHGADISNNSIGTNVSANGFDCDITGDYGVTASVIDSIVRGGLGSPFRVVWANGNERGVQRCGTSYHSTAPPAGAKNHITVGALNSNNDSMTGFSSWGPTDDGRIKPDISAPGCQSNGDGAVTSTVPGGGYGGSCGTSMASPTVCGLSALILQDFRAQYPGRPDPRNSTLKVFHAHTAEDRGNPGPDYQFGYGSVRVQRAIDFLRADDFYEDWTDQDHVSDFMIRIEPGDTELKVTIAWDDVPATPNVETALINDAGIIVTDPDGVRHFPWTLNPADPGAPAVQTQEDHVNNIEQVYVADPMEGVWRVQVVGYNVPEGPQVISIGGSPRISRDCDFNEVPDEQQIEENPDIDCAGEGIIDACEPDCDEDGVADTCVLFRGEDDDCNTNRVPDGCEPDCNENDIADECDLRDGFSDDCNANAVPDECDVVNGNSEDCNENGLPDECDIAERRSLDFNQNGVPDECDPVSTRHVDDDAPNDPGPGDPNISDPDEDGSPEHPFDAIQKAVDRSLTGDTVEVADGTYTGVGNRLIHFDGRPISLRSTGGANACSISLMGVGPAFFFRDGEPASAVVEGFTITGGVAANGGAMYFHSSGPTVRSCVIRGNRATGAGGGLFCSTNSFPTVVNCVIENNTASRQGGGVYATTGVDVLITDSIIAGNVATGRGGGVYARRGEVAIRNVTFSGNRSASAGGGVFCDLDADVTVTSSILWDDIAPAGDELAIADPASRLTVFFSDVEGGESGVDVASGTLVWGEGNIEGDPAFYDAGAGDYHVRSDSICVDAGDPARASGDDTDIDADARVFNDRVDIGADEFGCSIIGDHARFFACLTGPSGAFGSTCECADMDEDGDVDLGDWTIFQVLFPGE